MSVSDVEPKGNMPIYKICTDNGVECVKKNIDGLG